MPNPVVAIINASSVCADADVAKWAAAMQKQVSGEFARTWNKDATITFVPTGMRADPLVWQLVVLDDSDQQGALGYHDLTSQGLPLGKVFAKTTLGYGDQVPVTLSHELLEMLVDPTIDQMVALGSRDYSLEVCDAVEDDSLGYEIDGVLLSNFVLPSYFVANSPGPWDYKGDLAGPFPTLSPGGYIAWSDGTGWHQTMGDLASDTSSVDLLRRQWKARPLMGSRRYRRMIHQDSWVRSL